MIFSLAECLTKCIHCCVTFPRAKEESVYKCVHTCVLGEQEDASLLAEAAAQREQDVRAVRAGAAVQDLLADGGRRGPHPAQDPGRTGRAPHQGGTQTQH